jgi:hypothetical protein
VHEEQGAAGKEKGSMTRQGQRGNITRGNPFHEKSGAIWGIQKHNGPGTMAKTWDSDTYSEIIIAISPASNYGRTKQQAND